MFADGRSPSKLVAKGQSLLKAVEESFILTEGGHSLRNVPVFRPEEISLGKVLGTGGFAIVQEIRKFTLDDGDDASVGNAEDSTPENSTDASDAYDDDCLKTRKTMKQKATRNGDARYALKRLLVTLDEQELARGMLDLALEAKYLQIVTHPGIIKIRGIAAEPPISRGFFIVMDRLYDILDKRVAKWKIVENSNRGYLLGIGKNKRLLKSLLVTRMLVAYDLASAFDYFHQHRIVYRDIKMENIGFDVRDDVKVFDLGLCKCLNDDLKAKEGYGYHLTGRAGSIPYMAPEVVKMEAYDTACDVFSFAILLWEMLSLRQSFEGMGTAEYVESVVINKQRETVPRTFPPLTRHVLQEAWDDDPRKRPNMRRMAAVIRQDLNDMTYDETVLHRTRHMTDRSNHSVSLDLSGGNRAAQLPDYTMNIDRSKSLDSPLLGPVNIATTEDLATG